MFDRCFFWQGLREHSVVLMGKNTMMKRCIKVYVEEKQDDKWNVLLDYLVGNVGIIFTTVSIISVSYIYANLCNWLT